MRLRLSANQAIVDVAMSILGGACGEPASPAAAESLDVSGPP
jgi:hypothetical protein